MDKKKLIIGVVVIAAIIGLIVIIKSVGSKAASKKSVAAVKGAKKGMANMPVKKAISKGKGALTVKILNAKNIEIPMRIKVFKVLDSRASVYSASTVGSRTQELLPGSYDIEIDTTPQEIFKNVKVNEGKETMEDLGCVTGALTVKTINSKKAPAYYPLRVLYGKTNEMVTAFMTNKTLEIIPGVYDIEIGTSPRQYKKDVKIEAGKETIADLGCLTGTLVVKTTDEDKKDVRCSVRIMKADSNEIVASSNTNKPIELVKGKYNIEVMSSPKQSKKDVAINTGEESTLEFTVTAPPKRQAAPPRASRAQPARVSAAASEKTNQ